MTIKKNNLNKRDFIIGSLISAFMLIFSIFISSGQSLLAIAIPGIIFSWAIFAFMYFQERPIVKNHKFIFLIFAVIAIQLLLAAEQIVTGFYAVFPALYGGAAYSPSLFLIFTMIFYSLIMFACLLVFVAGRFSFLLSPILFFLVTCTIGNAIGHTYLAIYFNSYFPGLIVSQIYWVLTPIILMKFFMDYKLVGLFIALYILCLVPVLNLLMI